MIYLLASNQKPLLKKHLQDLLKSRLDVIDEFSVVEIDASLTLSQDIAFEATFLPLGTSRKALVIENAYYLLKTPSKNKIDKDQDFKELLKVLAQKDEAIDLIFLLEDTNFDLKNEVYLQIKKHGEIKIIASFNESDWFNYGLNYFKSRNVNIEKDALRELIIRIENNLTTFINEADKLRLYSNHITLKDVHLFIKKPLESNVFNLTKALFKGDTMTALDIFRDLRVYNVEPVTLISLLAGQFRLMFQTLYLSHRGLGEREIASVLKLHEYRTKMLLIDARRRSLSRILSSLEQLYELDLNIKSGRVDRFYGFELFLLNFN